MQSLASGWSERQHSNWPGFHDILAEGRRERLLIERERLGIMKVPTGLLPGRPAGMKHGRALLRGKAGHLKLFERLRWHRRNLRRILDLAKAESARLANQPVSRIGLELQPKQYQSQPVEIGM